MALFVLLSLHAENFFFDSDGVRIHRTVEGSGEPALLIHGLDNPTASERIYN